ncbi:MAG: hypothetical protein KDA59_26720, partial [Planctomycetales bacterium]|nr:hypothetical protein [Planctomycetales bacterium]
TCMLLERTGLLVTCVDHDAARLAACLAARRTLTAHLDIGSSVQIVDGHPRIMGDARLMLPGHGCVVCVGGMPNVEHRLYDLSVPADSLHHRLQAPWRQRRAGSLVTINAMTVAAGVQMWLDLLQGDLVDSHWQRLTWQPGIGLQTDAGTVGAASDCRFCRRAGR